MKTTSPLRTVAAAAIIGIVALAVGVLLARAVLPDRAAPLQLSTGTVLAPPRAMPSFTSLVDHTGAPIDAARLQGQWTFIFFGFTNCPDICPATLSMLAQIEKQFADLPAAQRPRVALFSVDPQRDTPEKLATYVQHFGASFFGITGEPEAIDRFTRELGVPVAITPLGEGAYTVDHSASIFLIDPNAELRALFSAPHQPQGLADDYRRVVRADANG